MPTLFFIKNTTNMGLFCGKRCQDRKDMKTLLKFQNKFEKTDTRATKHTAKYNAHSIGYYNGIDPNKAKWDSIGKMGAAGFDALGKGLSPGGGLNKHTYDKKDSKVTRQINFNGTTILLGAGVLLVLNNLMKPRKKLRR